MGSCISSIFWTAIQAASSLDGMGWLSSHTHTHTHTLSLSPTLFTNSLFDFYITLFLSSFSSYILLSLHCSHLSFHSTICQFLSFNPSHPLLYILFIILSPRPSAKRRKKVLRGTVPVSPSLNLTSDVNIHIISPSLHLHACVNTRPKKKLVFSLPTPLSLSRNCARLWKMSKICLWRTESESVRMLVYTHGVENRVEYAEIGFNSIYIYDDDDILWQNDWKNAGRYLFA